jgi:hypothetical protein
MFLPKDDVECYALGAAQFQRYAAAQKLMLWGCSKSQSKSRMQAARFNDGRA